MGLAAEIDDGLEFQGEFAFLTLFAEQGEAGRLAGPGRQRGIAQPAAAARGGFEAGAGADQIGQQATVLIEDDGAVGDPDFEIGARGAVPVATGTLFPGRSVDVRMEVKVQQRVHLRVDDQHDAAAPAPVTAVWAAQGLELLAVQPCPPAPARAWITTRSTKRGIGLPFLYLCRNVRLGDKLRVQSAETSISTEETRPPKRPGERY